MIELILQLKKGDEMGINVGLRLLTVGLFIFLLFLISYYFLVVNRNLSPQYERQASTISSPDAERIRQDAALASRIKSALAQTKRLQGYTISVENKEGIVTLSGDVPSPFDKELAGNVAKETPGIKSVNNRLQIVLGATPQTGENNLNKIELSINVEDLELQANLRERIASFPDLKNQQIEIKTQQRAVTLSGNAESEPQRARIEQIVRAFPKVTSVTNLLKVGGKPAQQVAISPAPQTATANTNRADQELTQQITAKLNANRTDFTDLNKIKIICQNGEVTLSGTISAKAEGALAEKLTREISAVKTVKNLLVIASK